MLSSIEARYRISLCPENGSSNWSHHVSVIGVFHILLQYLPYKENTLDRYGRDISLGTCVSGFFSIGYVVHRLVRAARFPQVSFLLKNSYYAFLYKKK